jgi:hypothetical protein
MLTSESVTDMFITKKYFVSLQCWQYYIRPTYIYMVEKGGPVVKLSCSLETLYPYYYTYTRGRGSNLFLP